MYQLEELTKMARKELKEELEKAQFNLFKLRLDVTSRQSKEIASIKGLRKYIARIKTIQRMQEFERAPENPKTSTLQ